MNSAPTLESVSPEQRHLPSYQPGEVDLPSMIGSMDEVLERDTQWTTHSHPTHELLWNHRGVSTVTVGLDTWTVTPSAGLWVPAGTPHEAFAPAGTWYRTAHFNVNSVPALAPGAVAVHVTVLLKLLLARHQDERISTASRELTESMIIDVLKPEPNALIVTVPQSKLLQPVVQALLADPSDNRSLEDWATELKVSSKTVTRTFHAQTGLGYAKWQAAVKAQRAALMLSRGDDVEDVAFKVGYSSISAFGAAFRRTTGLTPGQFRPSSES